MPVLDWSKVYRARRRFWLGFLVAFLGPLPLLWWMEPTFDIGALFFLGGMVFASFNITGARCPACGDHLFVGGWAGVMPWRKDCTRCGTRIGDAHPKV